MTKLQKYGKTKNGIQRYRCIKTNKITQETTMHQKKMSLKMLCIFLYYKTLSYRKVGKIFDISHVTVYYWVRDYSKLVMEHFNLSDKTQIADLEIDELYTFRHRKCDKIYVMTAVDRESYELIKFDVVEDKNQDTFDDFLDGIVDDETIEVSDYHTDAAPQYMKYFRETKRDVKN